jgi:hypothetical protein
MEQSLIWCAFFALEIAHAVGLFYGGNQLKKIVSMALVIVAAMVTSVGGWWEFAFVVLVCLYGRADMAEYDSSSADIVKGTAGICVLLMTADAVLGWLEWTTLYAIAVVGLAGAGFFATLVNSRRCA